MKKQPLNFDFIICDSENGSINFVHTGKLDLRTRLSYKCITMEKDTQYAFRARTPEEFLEFLSRTSMFESTDGKDLDFIIATLDTQTGQSYKTQYEFFINHATKNFNMNRLEYNTFISDARNLRARMIKAIKFYQEHYEKNQEQPTESENE